MTERKKKKKQKEKFWRRIFSNLKEETLESVWGVVFAVLALFLLFAALGKAGVAGATTYRALSILLGIGYFLLPLLFLILAGLFWSAIHRSLSLSKFVGAIVAFFAGLGLIEALFAGKGGLIGNTLTKPLIALFDIYAAFFVLVGLLLIALLILFDSRLPLGWLSFFTFARKKNPVEEDAVYEASNEENEIDDESMEEEETASHEQGEKETGESSSDTPVEESDARGGLRKILSFGKHTNGGESPFADVARFSAYSPPPLSLLERDKGKPGVGDIKANANIIKRTLQNFGVTVEVDEIAIGPSVTRYALKPAEGVRLSKIISLQTNLELALAAHPVRIEAPIPGRSLVGVEVPNSAKATVGLGTLLSDNAFQTSDKPLLVALGKDISGNSHFADIAKMPHLLIAGATGSGKSVAIHALITSLVFRNSPQHLRFIMIDPKRVELTLYNSIPHLLTPVITDAKKTILALKWAAREMERRYSILEAESVRDISSYHSSILAPAFATLNDSASSSAKEETGLPEVMPHLIIVIDELADIMQAYPRELEAAVVRLAQMSRAVGIHLILSTQRPSVNVITGLIKANIPARIALQVASQIDSRTILDGSGAEKLLGAGDMLYLSGDMSKPRRMQTAFISEQEVKKVVSYLRKQGAPEESEKIDFSVPESSSNILFGADLEEEDGEDELYEEAREIVVHAGKASTSYLQRKLRIGYSRAARLMDILEERGVIGIADGSRPREVLARNPDAEKPESSKSL